MPTYNRGGKSLLTDDIGRLSYCRQHLLLPGETMTPRVTGNVRLTGLRQQSSVYLHAQIDAFAAPVRWYHSGLANQIKDGINRSGGDDATSLTGWPLPQMRKLGCGAVTGDFIDWYAKHAVQVYNRWYKWPEDADSAVAASFFGSGAAESPKCVNLEANATRIRDAAVLGSNETDVSSATVLDVRDLALTQARYKEAMERDWIGMDRYIPQVRNIWGGKGSAEVDQVPLRLRTGAKLNVTPYDMYASDSAGLGDIMSISNFKVDHEWQPYTAEEHTIVCYTMVLRFAPILVDEVNPQMYSNRMTFHDYIGDPVIAAEQPEAVQMRDFHGTASSTIGYLPAGWRWRRGYNHVSNEIAVTGQFPTLEDNQTTAADLRDASNVQDAFRSATLKDWLADLDFSIPVRSRIPTAGRSIVAGSGAQAPKGNHPTGGFLA